MRSSLDVTITTGEGVSSVSGLRLRTAEGRPFEGVRVSGLGIASEERAFERARTRRFEVGSYAIERRVTLLSGIALRLESAGTFSLVQSTSPDGKPAMAEKPCASQSLFTVRVVVLPERLSPRLSVRLSATLEGDPFHLVSGAACVGMPPAWLSGETLGGEFGYRGERISVMATVARRTSRVSDTRDGFVTTSVSSPVVGLMVGASL